MQASEVANEAAKESRVGGGRLGQTVPQQLPRWKNSLSQNPVLQHSMDSTDSTSISMWTTHKEK